jgi:prepilin-type N-terminal cleavage/methylation domain-containing protein
MQTPTQPTRKTLIRTTLIGTTPVRTIQRRSSRNGFTLIELLVVIAIIAILASILFPVFAQAREKARQSSCLSNQKQLTMALNMYAQDYDDTLPIYSYGTLNSYLNAPGSFGYLGADGPRWADLIFPYVKSRQVFDCPDGGVHLNLYQGGSYFDTQTYSYGYSVQSLATSPDSNYGVAGRALAQLDAPGSTIMLADSRITKGEGSARITPVSYDTPLSLNRKVDGNRHSGARGLNITGKAFISAYADGHCKFVGLIDTLGNPPTTPDQWNTAQ